MARENQSTFDEQRGCDLGLWVVVCGWLVDRYPGRAVDADRINEITRRLGEIEQIFDSLPQPTRIDRRTRAE